MWCEHCVLQNGKLLVARNLKLYYLSIFGLFALIKKKVSSLEDSINSSPRSTSLGWWGNGWKSTYKGHGAHVFPKLLLMKEYQGHMSFFQACITQQEDTAVHPKTLDLFIWRVGRGCKRFKENLIFEILIQYHLHNWVRKWKYTCMSLGKKGWRLS